jgi:hypothetical protein
MVLSSHTIGTSKFHNDIATKKTDMWRSKSFIATKSWLKNSWINFSHNATSWNKKNVLLLPFGSCVLMWKTYENSQQIKLKVRIKIFSKNKIPGRYVEHLSGQEDGVKAMCLQTVYYIWKFKDKSKMRKRLILLFPHTGIRRSCTYRSLDVFIKTALVHHKQWQRISTSL